MSTYKDQRIVIVGGGLAGALLAAMLGKKGCDVTVCERRPDPRAHGFAGGRSINLALSVRGIRALKAIGLADAVLKDAIPMRGRMMHSRTGELTFQHYSSDHKQAINSVSRGGLNITLLDAAAQYPNVKLVFGKRCTSVETLPAKPIATFHDEATGETETVTCDLLIGADGAYSAVRAVMQFREGFNYAQEYESHGYKELSIPPTDRGDFAMEAHALHIWPRGGFMMIALPNADRSFTCTLFHPLKGKDGLEAMKTRADVIAFFEKHFPDAMPMMPTLADDFVMHPTGALVTIRCWPWQMNGNVVLVGDAAHAIVPFYGQGMNAAFEDCAELVECLEKYPEEVHKALVLFQKRRKVHADAIAEMAVENFVEMRDKVGSRAFLMHKKFEQLVHRVLPWWFTPQYNLISFSNVPYATARKRARRQWRMIKGALVAIGVLVVAGAVLLVRTI
jgi:kynurenine 3-monooxygenase